MLAIALLHFIGLKPQTTRQSELIRLVAESGRCVTLAESPDAKTAAKVQIAPGEPPILKFRYYEGKMHHRFGNSDLMLDDAGH